MVYYNLLEKHSAIRYCLNRIVFRGGWGCSHF